MLPRDVGELGNALQFAEELGEGLFIGESDLVAIREPAEDRVVGRFIRCGRLRLLAWRLFLLRAAAGERVIEIVVIDLAVAATLARGALADAGALDQRELRREQLPDGHTHELPGHD